MSKQDWLTESLESSLAAVIAILYRGGLSPERAADLAADGLSFACAQALKRPPEFATPEHCRNWAIRVACNHAYQVLRAEACHHKALQAQHAAARASDAGSVPRSSPLQPFLEALKDALALLPDADRRFIERHVLDGVTLEGIAAEFQLANVSAAWRLKARILRQLREILEKQGAVPDGWEAPTAAPGE